MDEPSPIKKARVWAGFENANQAARALGVDQSQYSKLERGALQPGRQTLVALSKGFGCRTDHILGLEELPPRDIPPATPAAS